MTKSVSFDHLGFGLGFRPCHYEQILNERPSGIDWLEVISENFMQVGGRPRAILERARALYPVAIHGVGMSIGSPDPIRTTYLRSLKELVDWLDPALISDHLCFTSLGRHNSHDLLPIPYTNALLQRVSERVDMVQELLQRRIMLENPSAYIAFENNEMSECTFLSDLVTRTGCGILLDVNNLYVNQMNLGLDPYAYIEQLPMHCVGQMHLAGHSIQETSDGIVRIDTHDHDILESVWSLYQVASAKFTEASVMIEWDDKIPELELLINRLDRARSLRSQPAPARPQNLDSIPELNSTTRDSEQTMKDFFSIAVDPQGVEVDDKRLSILDTTRPVPRLLGARVYNNAYFARLRDVLHDEFPTLAGVTTDDGFTGIASHYLQQNLPTSESMNDLGRHLPAFLRTFEITNFDFGVAQSILADLADLDRSRYEAFTHPDSRDALPIQTLAEITAEQWSKVRFQVSGSCKLLQLSHDATLVWQAIAEEVEPSKPELTPTSVVVWRHQLRSHHAVLQPSETALLEGILRGETFAHTANQWSKDASLAEDVATQTLVQSLVSMFERGMITEIYL